MFADIALNDILQS